MSEMGVKIEAGRAGHDTRIIVDGVDMSHNTNAYTLSSTASSITKLNISLIALRPMIIEGLAEVSIDVSEIPENLAREIYDKLKERFSTDRLKRKIKA